jgi:hypothetical protein
MASKAKHKWKSGPADVPAIASFRWFANTIENQALVRYMTNKGTFEETQEILRAAVRALGPIQTTDSTLFGHCPPGWIECEDGFCRPECPNVLKKPSRRRKR